MGDIKLSVIIPCYNAEKTLEDTLRSLEDSSEIIYEVICVNDGSKDNTLNVLKKYSNESLLNIKIIDSDNFGVSVARNKGIDASSGDVLLFLDADDKYSPLFFCEIIKRCEEYDTVYGYSVRDESKLVSSDSEIIPCKKSLEEIQLEFMVNKDRCHTAAFSYKKQILDKYCLRFEPGAKYGEDWEFTTKYLGLCKRGICLDASIFFYRDSENSAINSPRYEHTHVMKAAERTEKFLLDIKSDFYEEFCMYMRHRAAFSVAHNFSKFKRKDLFDKFISEYDVKDSMIKMVKSKHTSLKVKVAALSYVLSKKAFFYIVGRM